MGSFMDYGIRLKRPAKKPVLQIADLITYNLHALKNCVIILWTHLQCWNGRNAEVLIKFFTRKKNKKIYITSHTQMAAKACSSSNIHYFQSCFKQEQIS
jgi:sulfite reductase alpha subunit-like flavoprotein